MKIYIKVIKELKDLLFLLRFFNFKMIIKFFKHKFLIAINLKNYDKDYLKNENLKFSNSWFRYNLLDWLFIFDKKIKINNDEKINILEIGSYEGQSTYFFNKYFQNLEINCVDTWAGSDEHDKTSFSKVEEIFDKNISYFNNNNQIVKNKINSKHFFKINKKKFNIIYIDGSHFYKDVYRDALNAQKCLKKDGYIIFDDYLFNFYKNKNKNPITAINKFIKKFGREFEVISVFRQVFLKKN